MKIVGKCRWLAPLVGLLCSVSSRAGAEGTTLGDTFRCQARPVTAAQALEIATQTQKRYGTLGSLEASFTQESYLAALDTREQSFGTVTYQRPAKMRWDYLRPEAQTFLVRDTTVWFYQPREKQVLIDDFRNAVLSDLPVAFLLGVGDLARDFTVVEACASDRDEMMLTLRPQRQSTEEGMSDFRLLVNAKTFVPLGALVKDLAGNTTAIRFSSIQESKPVAATIFEASFPAGTDINDQRQAAEIAAAPKAKG